MPKCKYNTEHERYLGSGIIFLSQIQEIDPHHLHLCKKEQKEIESQFRRGACMPWLPESRLKVGIEKEKWEIEEPPEVKRLGGVDFHKLWFSDADIRIVEGAARFQAARVSSAAILKEVFLILGTEERWWVADFFEHDSTVIEGEAFDWEQKAVISFFSPPNQKWCETRPSGQSLLPHEAHRDAKLASTIPGVKDAFRKLDKIPSLWNVKNCTYLSDVRKSFCHEEIENYILAIGEQWKEITLEWKSEILKCVDFYSVNALQSRAPAISTKDFEFIEEKFEEGKILPLLKDSKLRHQVQSVILRQGPILTVDTFAKDVRLLQTRVREPLTGLMPRMCRKREDTLRREICKIIERELDSISVAKHLHRVTCEEREAFVRRCYYHVFLYTIRTKPIKNSITRDHIRSLVIDELNHLCIDNRGGLQNLMTREGVISTQAPVDDLLELEVGEKDRHGCDLLNKQKATKHLYYDQISNGCASTSGLTPSYMAMHIVRIFLLGREAIEREKAPISGSPTAIAEYASPISQSTSFNTSPISTGSSEDGSHTQNSPMCTATPTILNERRGRKANVGASAAPVESMAAELISGELLQASPTHTLTTKRSALVSECDIFGQGLTNDPRPVKRPRSQFPRQEEDNRGNLHDERQSPSVPDLMASSSVYSVADETSPIHYTSSGRLPSNSNVEKHSSPEIVEAYAKLTPEAYSKLIEDWARSNRGGQQRRVDVTSSRTGATAVARHTTSNLPQNISANAASDSFRTVGSRTTRHDFVLYRSKHAARRIPGDKQSTQRFVANQNNLVGKKTRFIYKRNEEIALANNAEQLWTAMTRYGVREVLVDSDSLGSLEGAHSLGNV